MGAATEAIKRRMAERSPKVSDEYTSPLPPSPREYSGQAPGDEFEDDEGGIVERSFNPQEEYDVSPLSKALKRVASVEVESVIGNALVRVRFERGTNPAEVLNLLHLFDANAQVRAEFPSKSFGPRETKSAPLASLAFGKNGATITCDLNEVESFNLDVWKNEDKTKCKFTQLISKLKTCGAMGEKRMSVLEKAEAQANIKLHDLGIIVKYSESQGRRFYEDLVIETVTSP